MTRGEFEAACRRLPVVSMVVQWGGCHVYKVGGRIFAMLDPPGESGLSIKVSEIAYEALTAAGQARPAPYLARAGWVKFDDLAALATDEGAALALDAHRLAAAKLTRKARAEVGLA